MSGAHDHQIHWRLYTSNMLSTYLRTITSAHEHVLNNTKEFHEHYNRIYSWTSKSNYIILKFSFFINRNLKSMFILFINRTEFKLNIFQVEHRTVRMYCYSFNVLNVKMSNGYYSLIEFCPKHINIQWILFNRT